jgi:hypothetical protein
MHKSDKRDSNGLPLIPQEESVLFISAQDDGAVLEIHQALAARIKEVENELLEKGIKCRLDFRKLKHGLV